MSISVFQREGEEERRVPLSEKQKPTQRFSHHFPKETIYEGKVGVWLGKKTSEDTGTGAIIMG